MSASQPSPEKSPTSPTQTKTFYERVEELKLWSDDETFKSQEYERRRIEKIQKKGVLKADKPLSRARSLYLPSILGIVFGTAVFLYATVNASEEEDPPLIRNREVLKIVGGILAGLGLVVLMATAAYTYRREDEVRRWNGYPTLFESSRVRGGGSVFGIHQQENNAAISEFKDKRRPPESRECSEEHQGSVRIVEADVKSSEVTEPLLFLVSAKGDESFSSVRSDATLKWLAKHGSYFYNPGSELKRQRSDSALDQSFARSSLYTSDNSFQSGIDKAEVKLDSRQERYEIVENITSTQANQLDKSRIQPKSNKHHQNSLTKHSNPLIKVEEFNKSSYSDRVESNDTELTKTMTVDNPGVSISSTDSSGYTSSDCYCIIEKEHRDSSSDNKIHNREMNQTYARGPDSYTIVVDLSSDRDTQTKKEHRQLLEQHNDVELCTRGQVCEELAKIDRQSCNSSEDFLASPAAIHNTWSIEENDGESLSPPISPDISSLPYLV